MRQPSLRDLLDDEALLDRLSRREDAGGDELGGLLAAVVERVDAPLPSGPRRSPRRRRFVAALGLAVAISGAGVAAAVTIPGAMAPRPATVQSTVATPSSPAPAGRTAQVRTPVSSGAAAATRGRVAATPDVPASGDSAGAATWAGSATALPAINTRGSKATRSQAPKSRTDAVRSAGPPFVAAPRTGPGVSPAADAKASDPKAPDANAPDANASDANAADTNAPDTKAADTKAADTDSKANNKSNNKSNHKGGTDAAKEGRTDHSRTPVPSRPAPHPERTAIGASSTGEEVSPASTSHRATQGKPAWAGVPGANAQSAAGTAPAPGQ